MTVQKRAEIKVTAKTDQAAQEFQKLSQSQDKAAASLQRYLETARKQNAADRFAGFDKGAASIAKNDAAMRGFSLTTSGVGAAFRTAALGAGAFMAVAGAAAGAVSDLATRGMEVQGVFNNLPFSIDSARVATRGLITDFELAKSANTLVSFGVVKTADDFSKLAAASQALGQKLGLTASSTMESLSAALGRNSKLMLDNLGIIMSIPQAEDRYAKSLGKTAAALTDTEKAEAFRVEAMKAIFAAAGDVKVVADGAAASVQRFSVEMQNLRDQALGGERAAVSLHDGIAKLDDTTRKLIATSGQYGADLNKVRKGLWDAGVSVADLNKGWQAYQATLATVVAEEAKLYEWQSKSNKTRKDTHMAVAAAVKEMNRIFGESLRGERLKEIEREIAYLGNNEKAQKRVNELLYEKAEITAFSLELAGELDKAEKVRFDEEIRALKAQSEQLNVRTSATKRLTAAEREFAAELARVDRFGAKGMDGQSSAITRGFSEGLEASKGAAGQKSFAEFRKQQQLDAMSAEIAGQESMLEIKLQGIERERAAGVDPWTLAQQERDAKMFALAAQDEYISRTLQGQDLLIAREEIAAQRRQVLHEAELQRIARDQRIRQQQQAKMAQIGNAVSRVHEGMAAAAIRGAFASGQSVKDSVKHFAAGEAIEMTITAATETIRGAVATASYNYPKAAMHFTNAGLAGAQAAALGATYGVLGGGGGGGKSVGGFGGSAFGPGASAGGGATNSPRSGSIGEGPPISRPTGTPLQPKASSTTRFASAPVINIYSITGPDAGQMTELRKALKQSERDDGDVN